MEEKPPTLYIVGTPIGNLNDITLRALEVLRMVAVVVCEDTRVTKRLFQRHAIPLPRLIATGAYASKAVLQKICIALSENISVALVTDAGTPGIADPGAEVVRAVTVALPAVKVVPIPGPSAIIAALSASGTNADSFWFAGFPPHKKGRETFFNDIALFKQAVVFYESPHRLEKALVALAQRCPDRPITLAREITKIYEEIITASANEHIERRALTPETVRGEFVLILAPIT